MNLVPSILPHLGSLYQNHFGTNRAMEDSQSRPPSDPADDSELDAEGEEVDEEYEQTVSQSLLEKNKIKPLHDRDEDTSIHNTDEEEDEEEESANSESTATNTSTDSEDNEWNEESEVEEEADSKSVNSHLCMFCGENEENDPADEFEEYLACRTCGKNAHRQCARDEDAFKDEKDGKNWLCQDCTLEEDEESLDSEPVNPTLRRRSSALKAVSISANDDSEDASRSLRKRKASDLELPQRPLRARRRGSDPASTSAGADQSPSVFSDQDLDLDLDDDSVKPSRLRRLKKSERELVSIVSSEGISLIVSFCLDAERMQKILTSRARKNRYKEKSKKKIQVEPIVEEEPPHYPAIPATHGSHIMPLLERELEDNKTKPYGGILTEAEADTSNTFPLLAARQRFEDARVRAEEDWKMKMTATNNAPEPTKPSQKMSGPPSKIKCINFGGYEIDTLNAAPYPEEYSRNKILYICEFCLKYMNSDFVAWRHKLKCAAMHPPGDEIYRDGKYSFFEVDGRKNPVYCQNLCLLAKLFLGSKTLYYDVEPFLFYVMTENDDLGCHFVGYFSKEKRSSSMNNVSCILVLPVHQRRGFGHMLIEFSYLLTRVEEKTGSPEKPLSDMGLVSYRAYWRLMMCYELINQKGPVSISELSNETGMTPDDVISALEGLRALVRDPVTKEYALRLDYTYFKEFIANYEKKKHPRINPDSLVWVPYVMNRGLTMHYEGGGPLHTVAPREDEEADESDKMEVDDEAQVTKEDVVMVGVSDGDEPQTNGVNGAMTDTNSAQMNGDSRPSTPLPNGHSADVTGGMQTPERGSIPPSRFEIFPSVPGMSGRKRGRPPGSRRGRPPITPQSSFIKAHSTAIISTIQHSNGSPTLRRTRSAITDVTLVNGDDGEEDADHIDSGSQDEKTKSRDDDSQAKEGDSEVDAEGEEDS